MRLIARGARPKERALRWVAHKKGHRRHQRRGEGARVEHLRAHRLLCNLPERSRLVSPLARFRGCLVALLLGSCLRELSLHSPLPLLGRGWWQAPHECDLQALLRKPLGA